jgi:hypothetical protein
LEIADNEIENLITENKQMAKKISEYELKIKQLTHICSSTSTPKKKKILYKSINNVHKLKLDSTQSRLLSLNKNFTSPTTPENLTHERDNNAYQECFSNPPIDGASELRQTDYTQKHQYNIEDSSKMRDDRKKKYIHHWG